MLTNANLTLDPLSSREKLGNEKLTIQYIMDLRGEPTATILLKKNNP